MAPSFRVSVDVQFIIRVLSLLSVLQLSAKHHIDMCSLIITMITIIIITTIITTALHHDAALLYANPTRALFRASRIQRNSFHYTKHIPNRTQIQVPRGVRIVYKIADTVCYIDTLMPSLPLHILILVYVYYYQTIQRYHFVSVFGRLFRVGLAHVYNCSQGLFRSHPLDETVSPAARKPYTDIIFQFQFHYYILLYYIHGCSIEN